MHLIEEIAREAESEVLEIKPNRVVEDNEYGMDEDFEEHEIIDEDERFEEI